MTGDKCLPEAVVYKLVRMIASFDFDHITRPQVVQVNAAFYFGLDEMPINLFTKIPMGKGEADVACHCAYSTFTWLPARQ